MKIRKVLGEYMEALLELIYPPVTMEDLCTEKIPFISDHSCIQCGRGLRMMEDGPKCQECMGKEYHFHRAISVVKYEGEMKDLIYAFKYAHRTYVGRVMGWMMADKIKAEGMEIDLILPVPLYGDKEKERGFNQATILSKYISKKSKIPFNIDVLTRTRNTKVMHNLTKRERQENVTDAFKVLNNGVIINKNILLVDDILTTGSTVNECSKILLNFGAKTVTVLTFARD